MTDDPSLNWCLREFTIGSRILRLRVPAEPDALLESMGEGAGVDEPEPYWAAVWPAAIEMARWVAQHPWPPNTRAIELGCGVGLVGLAGLAAGLDVLLTDNAPRAVEAAVANAHRNGFTIARGQVLDWREPSTLPRFLVVLAADVLYDRQSHQPLLETLAALLDLHGEAWIGEPGRSVAADFVRLATTRGFRVDYLDSQSQAMRRESAKLGAFRLLRLQFSDGSRDPSTAHEPAR